MPEWNVPGYAGLRTLGSGGFGDVVLARHHVSGILVAIKYLHRDLLADGEFAAMFRGEAVTLASLDDLNVVRLYEYVESSAGAAIVMELIDGVSLRDILAHQGGTTAEAALVVLQGSLLGLAAAHQRGVVHRDYKPENVLVDGDGMSKLTDFGIAARAGDLPVPAGTLLYAAPEQMAGAPASPASDVYAATATFYECLTGHPPFGGEPAELVRQHCYAPVPLDPVPAVLRPLVAAGMAKDPRQRPADARTFVRQLETAAAGAYGRHWQDRGRSHLGEAALLLAALWPSGGPPAVQGSAVERIRLRRHFRLRHLSPVKAVIAAGVAISVVAAGTALAATGSFRPAAANRPAPVQSVTLKPSPSLNSSPISPTGSTPSSVRGTSPGGPGSSSSTGTSPGGPGSSSSTGTSPGGPGSSSSTGTSSGIPVSSDSVSTITSSTVSSPPFTTITSSTQTTSSPPPPQVPEITSVSTYTQGVFVYFDISYSDPGHDAEGFGFVGVNGSGWAEETHPFSSPSYGIVGTDSIAYPFNEGCATGQQYDSYVQAWIYDTAGNQSSPVVIHLVCSGGSVGSAG
jgi:serine/threonine protein kinase